MPVNNAQLLLVHTVPNNFNVLVIARCLHSTHSAGAEYVTVRVRKKDLYETVSIS